MKWAIACVKENKIIGYWSEGKIRTKTIELYSHEEKKDLEREFYNAGLQIVTRYDETIIPIIMKISSTVSAELAKDWANLHLESIKSNWPHMPLRVAAVEDSIKIIKSIK